MLFFHNCTGAGLLENAQNRLPNRFLQISASDFRKLV
jgi:hypothetical protein